MHNGQTVRLLTIYAAGLRELSDRVCGDLLGIVLAVDDRLAAAFVAAEHAERLGLQLRLAALRQVQLRVVEPPDPASMQSTTSTTDSLRLGMRSIPEHTTMPCVHVMSPQAKLCTTKPVQIARIEQSLHICMACQR